MSDDTELALIAMSPATMDRRLAPDRAKLQFRGRSHTKPGSLLKDASEFINWHLLRWCEQQMLTFTRSRPGNSNDGAHVEQKNWAVVHTIVGYLRYHTTPELLLSNQIWKLQSLMTNFFYPQQKLVSKVRNDAKVTKTYDRPRTPMFRADAHHGVAAADKSRLAEQYADLNPAAIQRQIQGLTAQLLALATGKGAAARRPDPKRASADESTTTSKRAS